MGSRAAARMERLSWARSSRNGARPCASTSTRRCSRRPAGNGGPPRRGRRIDAEGALRGALFPLTDPERPRRGRGRRQARTGTEVSEADGDRHRPGAPRGSAGPELRWTGPTTPACGGRARASGGPAGNRTPDLCRARAAVRFRVREGRQRADRPVSFAERISDGAAMREGRTTGLASGPTPQRDRSSRSRPWLSRRHQQRACP